MSGQTAARACSCRCERCGCSRFVQHDYFERQTPVLVLWTLRGRVAIRRKGEAVVVNSHATNVRCESCGAPVKSREAASADAGATT